MKGKNSIITVAFGFLSAGAFGQAVALTDAQIGNSGPSKLIFATLNNGRCEVAVQLAEKDIANKLPFLCLFGSIAPTVMVPSDFQFEQKFQVHYYEYGCSPAENVCMVAYNVRIFRYLQRNYAKAWWKSIRKDTVGFKEWKKSVKL